MAPLRALASALLFLSAANAHFELAAPTPLEGDSFNEELEANAPCGGGVPDLSKNPVTDFHVGGDAIAVNLFHAQSNWLIRATLDDKAAANWTQLFPIVTQSGRGSFCEPVVSAPKEWVGKKGFIGVASKATDGILFQCAAVKFVSGANTSPDSSCTNGTAVSASFNEDADLTALVGSGSATTDSPSATPSTPNAAPSLMGGALPVGSFVVTGLMVLVGGALL